MIKLSRQSKFLLRYLYQRFPLGISSISPIEGATWNEQPGMVHMRGLIRRGWAKESDKMRGVFFLTDKGETAAIKLGISQAVSRPPDRGPELERHDIVALSNKGRNER